MVCNSVKCSIISTIIPEKLYIMTIGNVVISFRIGGTLGDCPPPSYYTTTISDLLYLAPGQISTWTTFLEYFPPKKIPNFLVEKSEG